MPTLTGRLSRSEPVIQNLPGSLANDISWAMERMDFRPVWARLIAEGLVPEKPAEAET